MVIDIFKKKIYIILNIIKKLFNLNELYILVILFLLLLTLINACPISIL